VLVTFGAGDIDTLVPEIRRVIKQKKINTGEPLEEPAVSI